MSSNKILVPFVLSFLIHTLSFAEMNFALSGILTTVTHDRVGVETKNAVYFLKKELLSPIEKGALDHPGKTVTFHIKPEAIESVRSLTASAKPLKHQ